MFGRRLVSSHQAQVLAERARFMRFSPRAVRSISGVRSRGRRPASRFVVSSSSATTSRTSLAPKVRLVVEVDGSAHDGRAHHDAARDRALNALGWHVLRVTEHDVVTELHTVVQRIIAVASAFAHVGR